MKSILITKTDQDIQTDLYCNIFYLDQQYLIDLIDFDLIDFK